MDRKLELLGLWAFWHAVASLIISIFPKLDNSLTTTMNLVHMLFTELVNERINDKRNMHTHTQIDAFLFALTTDNDCFCFWLLFFFLYNLFIESVCCLNIYIHYTYIYTYVKRRFVDEEIYCKIGPNPKMNSVAEIRRRRNRKIATKRIEAKLWTM